MDYQRLQSKQLRNSEKKEKLKKSAPLSMEYREKLCPQSIPCGHRVLRNSEESVAVYLPVLRD